MARLAAAKAEKPANRPIDLGALGIPAAAAPADTPAKPPQPSPRPADGARALPHLKGRRYTHPEPGFAVELPATGGPWRLGPGGAAGVPLQAKSADGAVVLEVLVRDLAAASASPRQLGEAMAKQVEDGGGRVLRAGLAAAGGAYDLEVERELAGRTVREWRRLHVRGSRLFEASGTAPVESWTARAAEVATFLDSFAPSSDRAAPARRP